MIAVFDTNVIVSAIFWHRSTARRCLAELARRRFGLAVSAEIASEYILSCEAMRLKKPGQNPSGPLAWVLSRATYFEPAAVGKQRSRDPKDDPFLACAMGATATHIVTNDRDLLDLEKPFGILIVTPAQFLRLLRA